MLDARIKEVFSGFPPEFLWHLLMDYNRRDQGCDAFEKVGVAGGEKPERHYLNGVFRGLNFVFQTFNEPLSVKYLLTLFRQATKNVSVLYTGESGPVFPQPFKSHYRNTYVETSFGLIPNDKDKTHNITKKGFNELVRLIQKGPAWLTGDLMIRLNSGVEIKKGMTLDRTLDYFEILQSERGDIVRTRSTPDNLKYSLEQVIDSFHREIKSVGAEDEKIKAIAKCIHTLELIHPFDDGNCRTMNLLMNKLLLQYGLMPSILENPNRIDAYAIDEIVDEIKQGQERFVKLKTWLPAESIKKDVAVKGRVFSGGNDQIETLVSVYQRKHQSICSDCCSFWSSVVPVRSSSSSSAFRPDTGAASEKLLLITTQPR